MNKLKIKPRKGISRIDSPSTHGWFVRAYKNSQVFSKLFSDKKLGGKTKALAAAKKYRDELYIKVSKIKSVRNVPQKSKIKTVKKSSVVKKKPRSANLLKKLEKAKRKLR